MECRNLAPRSAHRKEAKYIVPALKLPLHLPANPFRSKHPIVGLDLGAFRWRLLWLSETGELHRRWLPAPPPNTSVQSDALRRLLQEEKPPARRAVASLGGERLSLARLDVPGRVGGRDLRAALRFQLAQHFPLAATDAVWDHLPLPAPPGGQSPTTPLLVAVAPKAAALALADLCRAAGTRLLALDADPFAFQRGLAHLGLPTAGLWGLLDLGERGSRLVLYDDELPLLHRNLSFAGNQIRRIMMETFSLDETAADDRLLQGGVAVTRLLATLVEGLGAECEETINFYLAGQRGRTLGVLHLAGGGANLPGLASRLAEELQGTLDYRLDPGFTVSPVFSGQADALIGPEWLLALGLGLRTA